MLLLHVRIPSSVCSRVLHRRGLTTLKAGEWETETCKQPTWWWSGRRRTGDSQCHCSRVRNWVRHTEYVVSTVLVLRYSVQLPFQAVSDQKEVLLQRPSSIGQYANMPRFPLSEHRRGLQLSTHNAILTAFRPDMRDESRVLRSSWASALGSRRLPCDDGLAYLT